MEQLNIDIGSIVKETKTNKRFRVIYRDAEYTNLCRMDCTTLDVFFIPTEFLFEEYNLKNIDMFYEKPFIIDESILNDSGKQKFQMYKDIIREFSNKYGPTFDIVQKKDKSMKLYTEFKKYGIGKTAFWKIIRLYLQSGLNTYALIDKRFIPHKTNKPYDFKTKSGRKPNNKISGVYITDVIENQFMEGVTVYKKGRLHSIRNVYDYLIGKHYSTLKEVNGKLTRIFAPLSEIPTYHQFYYYLHKQIDKREMTVIKSSQREYRNKHRLLDGDSLTHVYGPGYLIEMDTVEANVSLVSESNKELCIGRAVVYAMIDVYTRCIVAVSVGLENNSKQGFINCMINLAEDKVDYCKRYGIDIKAEQWPSNFIPQRMRFDRGSDYKSEKVKQILNELGISRELVPGASGSLKGLIEQWFHQLDRSYADQVEGNGYIEKRHDSNHHEESALTIRDFTKLVINHVIAHNEQSMKSYPLGLEMLKEKVQPIPLHLWNYGCELFGNPRPITKNNAKHFAYGLMTEVKSAKISRHGLEVDGLYYENKEDRQLEIDRIKAGNKKVKFDCRMDLQDVGRIYYIRGTELMTAVLSAKYKSNEFDGLTREEYLRIKKIRNQINLDNEYINQQIRSTRYMDNLDVIEEAVSTKKSKSSTKHMSKNRKNEKKELAKQNLIIDHVIKESSIESEIELSEIKEPVKEDLSEKFTSKLEEARAKYKTSQYK